jgi:outer membrane autotransporter protein
MLIVLLVATAALRPLQAQSIPSNGFIDGNEIVTAPAGATTVPVTLVVGSTTGVNATGVPGGKFIVPTGASVVLPNLIVGFQAGSTGLVTVNGGTISTTNPESQYFIGSNGSGTMIISHGGQVFSNLLTFVGANAGSSGVLTVDGQGSSYTSGFFLVGNGGPGQLTVTNGGVASSTPSATLQIGANNIGAALVSGTGSRLSAGTSLAVGVNPGSVGTLTINDGGTATSGTGTFLAFNAGSTGTLNIGASAGNPPAAPGTLNASTVTFGAGTGDIVFNHTDRSGNYVFAPVITGGSATTSAVDVFSGTTVMTGVGSNYFGSTTIHGGILAAGAANVFSPNSNYAVQTGGTLNLNGFNQTVASVTNAGRISIGTGTPPGTTLTTTNYVGNGGTIAMNTFLGADNSPSDKLIIDGATGNTLVRITNVGGPGTETTGNGIPVVQTFGGATTTPGAFTLLGEARGGAYDYFLFRGGLNGSDPTVANDWFLRSTFIVGPPLPVEPEPFPPGVLPPDPPLGPLPPGIYPIIGPEIATYGVVQPIARQMGMATLGTLHERAGDTLEGSCGNAAAANVAPAAKAPAAATPDSNCKPGLWGRVFGASINNSYQAFADPRAAGQIAGIQTGFDFFRGSPIAGHSDTAGVYLAYTNGHVNVDGLVTNPAATGYEITRTGTVGMNAYSIGAYWTHYGPTGWYIDAVMQGTGYDGSATTQFANLPITGSGVVTSLEAGYPIPLSWFGPRFVLEPQGQIIWQQVTFNDANDNLGPVGLGTTSGVTGRLGLRGQWTVTGANGMVWQPYVRANVWRDWGAEANTTFGIDQVPLIEQATRIEFGGGVTAKLGTSLSVFAQGGYQFATSESGTFGFRRDSVKGDIGVRYTW